MVITIADVSATRRCLAWMSLASVSTVAVKVVMDRASAAGRPSGSRKSADAGR
jgi:hypothetical protein